MTDSATIHYRRAEFQSVLDAGPHPDEDWFRLQVSGTEKTKHLNITPAELEAIRDVLCGTGELWVLVIEHRHGTDTSVHRSEEAARQALYGFVDQWWGQELPARPVPGDAAEAIHEYFDLTDESYTLAPTTV